MLLAEKALAAGTLNPDVLRRLYRQWDMKLDPNPPALTKVTADDVRGRALLFQSASLQTVPTARAEVIARAIDLTRGDRGEHGPDLTVVGKVYVPLLDEMEPSTELIWFAGDAVRALLAAGEPDKAKRWLDLAHTMARTSSDAALIDEGLFPIERLMNTGGGGAVPARALQAWIATLPEDTAAAARASALILLTAVGDQVSAADWQPLFANLPAASPSPTIAAPVWNGLAVSARGKEAGASALFALIALGDGGPGRVNFATIQTVVGSLVAVGRESDARALALEAALVQGL
jgi:hypothetical protein